MTRSNPPQTRSQLYVPAHHPAWFAKAIAAGADALIIDLEDSVPIDAKAAAREAASGYLQGRQDDDIVMRVRIDDIVMLVRVNDASTPLFLDDMIAMVQAGATGIVLPKVSGPDDVVAADGL